MALRSPLIDPPLDFLRRSRLATPSHNRLMLLPCGQLSLNISVRFLPHRDDFGDGVTMSRYNDLLTRLGAFNQPGKLRLGLNRSDHGHGFLQIRHPNIIKIIGPDTIGRHVIFTSYLHHPQRLRKIREARRGRESLTAAGRELRAGFGHDVAVRFQFNKSSQLGGTHAQSFWSCRQSGVWSGIFLARR
jgi:hypothetical protein